VRDDPISGLLSLPEFNAPTRQAITELKRRGNFDYVGDLASLVVMDYRVQRIRSAVDTFADSEGSVYGELWALYGPQWEARRTNEGGVFLGQVYDWIVENRNALPRSRLLDEEIALTQAWLTCGKRP